MKKLLVFGGKFLVLSIILSTLIFQLPSTHYKLLKTYVDKNLVKITNLENTSGGTGVHVQLPSGKTAILTNAHVCQLQNEKGQVLVWSNEIRSIPRRVLEQSSFTDLCLVEGIEGIKGIKVADKAEKGVEYYEIGHPKLLPTNVSRGEFLGISTVQILDHIMNPSDPEDRCDLPKNEIVEAQILIFTIKACIVQIDAYSSNLVTLPGNSGSPVVNWWGKIVGVAFASDNDVYWGFVITLDDIKAFIKPY